MKRMSVIYGLVALILALPLAGAAVEVPVPGAVEAHEEAVTNVALAASDQNTFSLSLELDALASNNVEIGFGTDADGDGALSDGETEFVLGWRPGMWTFLDCASDARREVAAAVGRQTLAWSIRHGERGPIALTATLNATPILADWSSHPPEWVFRRRWNCLRVVARGTRGVALISYSRTNVGLRISVR